MRNVFEDFLDIKENLKLLKLNNHLPSGSKVDWFVGAVD